MLMLTKKEKLAGILIVVALLIIWNQIGIGELAETGIERLIASSLGYSCIAAYEIRNGDFSIVNQTLHSVCVSQWLVFFVLILVIVMISSPSKLVSLRKSTAEEIHERTITAKLKRLFRRQFELARTPRRFFSELEAENTPKAIKHLIVGVLVVLSISTVFTVARILATAVNNEAIFALILAILGIPLNIIEVLIGSILLHALLKIIRGKGSFGATLKVLLSVTLFVLLMHLLLNTITVAVFIMSEINVITELFFRSIIMVAVAKILTLFWGVILTATGLSVVHKLSKVKTAVISLILFAIVLAVVFANLWALMRNLLNT